MKTKDKVVLITGGGSGIGLALALAFLAEGSKVIICGRNLDKLQKVKEVHKALEIAQCDISNDEHIKALEARCEKDFGGVDILINNAGIFNGVDYTSGNASLEEQLKEIDIDFSGPVKMSHYFLGALLKKKEAALVNVTSGLAFVPMSYGPIYCASKAGLHSWTLSLRHQLKSTSVKVFELMPPLVDTPMVEEFKDMPKMPAGKLADEFIKAFHKNKYEVTPGQASQLKLMSRLAPGFIFKQLNKS